MSAQSGHCNGPTAINFVILTAIRGSAPLMMYFAISNLQLSGLVVALKCVITVVFFCATTLWQSSGDIELRSGIKKSFQDTSLYWRLAVVGLLQSAGPYILTLYSLHYLPPTMVGAFIVTIPWWGILFERLPFVQLRQHIPIFIKAGMVCGFIGILMMLVPIINESVVCINQAPIIPPVNYTRNVSIKPTADTKKIYDTCLTTSQLLTATLSLFLAPILWGAASVFWKCHRRETHNLVQSIGQNLVGGFIATLVWLATKHTKDVTKADWDAGLTIFSIIFLGVAIGWLATLLVQYLFHTIGAKYTNQVLTAIPFIAYLEDNFFVNDVITRQPYIIAMEIVGLLFLTGGVFISHLPNSEALPEPSSDGRRSSLSDRLLDPNPLEGENAGLSQAYGNNIHHYEPISQVNSSVEGLDFQTDTEEELNTDLPPLTQVI